MDKTTISNRISVEALVQSGELGISVLHPGGLESTLELARLCHVRHGTRLLDVASGTGESACVLAKRLGCDVTGVDHSNYMIETAKHKAIERDLKIEFMLGDAHSLPFQSGIFDAVISECTTCALEKQKAIQEMVRVTRPGGYVGISDLYWRDDAPESAKAKLAELENERPESLMGWKLLFQVAGLQDIETKNLSDSLATMTTEVKKQLGLSGQLKVLIRSVRRWGLFSLRKLFDSERILHNENLGYAIIIGRKPREDVLIYT